MRHLLIDRVRHRRPGVPVTSSTGATVDSPPTVVANNLPAALQSRSATYRQLSAGQDEASDWLGVFLPDADVRTEDIIDLLAPNGTVQQTFIVTFVKNVRGHHLECDLSTEDEP